MANATRCIGHWLHSDRNQKHQETDTERETQRGRDKRGKQTQNIDVEKE